MYVVISDIVSCDSSFNNVRLDSFYHVTGIKAMRLENGDRMFVITDIKDDKDYFACGKSLTVWEPKERPSVAESQTAHNTEYMSH